MRGEAGKRRQSPGEHLHLGVGAEEEESSKETKKEPRQGAFQEGERDPLYHMLQRESNRMRNDSIHDLKGYEKIPRISLKYELVM